MKKKLKLLSALVKGIAVKIILVWYSIRDFFKNCYGYLRSVYILKFKGIEQARVFYGYNHYSLAIKYADKRASQWPPSWDQLGQEQSVQAYGEESLIVISKMELKKMQKMGFVNDKIKYRKIFKNSYYTSK